MNKKIYVDNIIHGNDFGSAVCSHLNSVLINQLKFIIDTIVIEV